MKEKDSNSNYNILLNNLFNILKDLSNKESSFATFYQSESIIVGLNDFFPFNISTSTNDDIILLNPTTIQVKKSGVYHIVYKIPISNKEDDKEIEESLGLYVNGILQKNIQRTFAVVDPTYKKRKFIIEDLIIYIKNNSLLQLKNNAFFSNSKPIYTCNSDDVVSTFNIVKIG